jgi:hypothetical protein
MTFKRRYQVTREVSGPKTFRKWEEYSSGDIVIGQYVGDHEDTTYGKTHRKIKVEDVYFKGEKPENFIGKTLVLNSAGFLDKAFDSIQIGEIVQVEYTGKGVITKGPYKGKEGHTGLVNVVTLEDDTSDDEGL